MRPTATAAILALVAAAPVPAARPSGEDKLAGYLKGYAQSGEATSCIPQYRTNRSSTIDRIGVVYDVGGTRYLMRFQDGCDQLTEFTLFSTDTPTTQLCSGDIARVYQNGPPNIFLGTCIVGKFVPYKREG